MKVELYYKGMVRRESLDAHVGDYVRVTGYTFRVALILHVVRTKYTATMLVLDTNGLSACDTDDLEMQGWVELDEDLPVDLPL
jgi:hypothetical protein